MHNNKLHEWLRTGTLLFCLISIYLLFVLFVSNNHQWILFFMQFAVFGIAIWLGKNSQNYKRDLALLLFPFVVLFFIVAFFIEKNGYVRGVPYIILLPLVSFVGVFAYRKKALIMVILILLAIPVTSFILYPNWRIFNLERNRETVAVGIDMPVLNLIDRNQQLVKLSKEKMMVMDFWTTSCGRCFKTFPDFEKLKEKYDGNSNIEFYSINNPIKRDYFAKTVALVDDLGYSFTTLYAVDRHEIEERLRFNLYPHVYVVKNNKVIYSGSLNIGKEIFIHNLETIIERNL